VENRSDSLTAERRRADDALWTADGVAAFLKVSLSMVYKLVKAGRLPAVRIGALYRFQSEQVRAFARGEGPGTTSAPVLSPGSRRRV